MAHERTTQQEASRGARDILRAVASGKTDAEALGLRGSSKRVLGALTQGRLLRRKVVTKLELTEAGKALLEGAAPGKALAASLGALGDAARRQRGRPRDPNSARSRAFDLLSTMPCDLARKHRIASLVNSLEITPQSASTYIHEFTKAQSGAA